MGKNRNNYTNYNTKISNEDDFVKEDSSFNDIEDDISEDVEILEEESDFDDLEDDISEDGEIIDENFEEDVKTVTAFIDIPEGKFLNVRSGKSLEFDPVTQLSNMQEVVILEEDDVEWYKICTASGLEGYAQKKYVKLDISDR